jgi:drug/metabolite transporter (DMT)-like permease
MWFPLQIGSVVCWALVNLLDSVLVEHFHKKPYALQWHQSYISVVLLIILFSLYGAWTPWSLGLMAVGILTCFGDWMFFACLNRMDVSVTQIAWGMMAVMLSIGGFLFFHETWSLMQLWGVVLLFIGVLLLSLWGKSLTPMHVLYLFILAALNVPFYLMQKAALTAGMTTMQTFLWAVLGREGISLIIPLLIPSWRGCSRGFGRPSIPPGSIRSRRCTTSDAHRESVREWVAPDPKARWV